jgi:hypothetical protein
MLEIILYIFLVVTTIISFYFRKKFKNSIYKYFAYFLVFLCITETLSQIFNKNNALVYNFYTLIAFNFYFIFYYQIFREQKNKRIMVLFILSFMIFYIVDTLFLTKDLFYHLLNNTVVFGSFLTIITLIVFLFEIIKNKDIVFNIKKTFIFWVSVGLLLFYIGILPIMITFYYLKTDNNQIYSVIITLLNYIMLGSFSYGYIYSDKKYNY